MSDQEGRGGFAKECTAARLLELMPLSLLLKKNTSQLTS